MIGLLRVLDPNAVARAEGPTAAALLGASRQVTRSEAVARSALMFRSLAGGARWALVNGAPGFVVFVDGRPFSVLGFRFAPGRLPNAIAGIDAILSPDRLAHLLPEDFEGPAS